MTYRSFCNAFAPSMHEGTTGSDEKVVEHNVTHEEQLKVRIALCFNSLSLS